MADKIIELDPEEVLAHLKHILGDDFVISESQLATFIHDLRKLIRRDQKRFETMDDDCRCNCHNKQATEHLSSDSEQSESDSIQKSVAPKPALSFIRPWNVRPVRKKGMSKNLKEDPVKLHQHYQSAWQNYRFPGETSHSDLRWNIRERMLGQGPQPRDDDAQFCPCACCNNKVPGEKRKEKEKYCLKIEITIKNLG